MSLLDRSLSSDRSPASPPGNGAARNPVEDRRFALFRETPLEICQRVALGTAWALRPRRVGKLLPLAQLWLADLMAGKRKLPGHEALKDNCEFAGMVHDLSVPTLLAAYARGLFPYGHFGPLKWTSPVERCVLFFDEFHVSTRLRSIMRQGKHAVTFDRDFESVIKECAGRREGRWHLTWITPRMMRAYARLHDEGHVHSFEVWNKSGALIGGGYGVALGRTFVIESQFFRESNASKIGFSVLAWHLAKWGFRLCDNKWQTPTTSQMGFRLIPRSQFLQHLALSAEGPGRRGRWEPETGPETVAGWRVGTPDCADARL